MIELTGLVDERGKIVYITEGSYKEEEAKCPKCGTELETHCAETWCDLVCPVCGFKMRLPRALPCPICGRPASPTYCPHCGWRSDDSGYDDSLPREKKIRTHLTHEESQKQLQNMRLVLQKAPDDPYTILSGIAEAIRIKRKVPKEYSDIALFEDGCAIFPQCGVKYCGRWDGPLDIEDVVYALEKWGKPRGVNLEVEGGCVVYNGQRYCGGGVPEELALVAAVGKCYDVRMIKLAEALGVYSALSTVRTLERIKGKKARLQDDRDSTPPGIILYENPLLNLATCLGVDENMACAAFVEHYVMSVLYGGEMKCLKEGKEACRSWREAVGRKLLKYISTMGIGKRVSRGVLAMILTAAYAAVARGEMRAEDFKAMVIMLSKTQKELEPAYKLFVELWTQSARYDGVVAELKKLEQVVKL